jgi:hypothetical protein
LTLPLYFSPIGQQFKRSCVIFRDIFLFAPNSIHLRAKMDPYSDPEDGLQPEDDDEVETGADDAAPAAAGADDVVSEWGGALAFGS